MKLFCFCLFVEQLTCAAIQDVKKDWEKDYDRCIVPLIEENIPCYILYRLDKKTSLGSYGWLLLSYIPDTATIRQKMLYASTKATLKIEFGSSNIQEELHATQIDETTYDGYLKNKKAFSSPAPLTTREEELQELKKTEINTDISTETRHQTLAGINFPLTIDTIDAIKDMLKGSYDYLQFQIDLEVCPLNFSGFLFFFFFSIKLSLFFIFCRVKKFKLLKLVIFHYQKYQMKYQQIMLDIIFIYLNIIMKVII